jgi:prevent-host-death family protein
MTTFGTAAMGKMIGAAEFKAHCLRILDEVQRTGEPVTITKRGKPVAEVKPIKATEKHSVIGALQGSVTRIGDIISPAYEQRWNAELGILDPDE